MFLLVILFLHGLRLISSIEMDQKGLAHIVIIAPPFFGHMIPLLDFAKHLSQYHYVTYVVSASKVTLLEQYGFLNENKNNSKKLKLDIIGLLDENKYHYEVDDSSTIPQIIPVLNRMRRPLSYLLFPQSATSFAAIPSTRPISRPIDVIISDLFVISPILEGHHGNVMTYIFVPNNLMTYIHYINTAAKKIKNDELGLDFDREVYSTIPLAKGLIFNSILELDQKLLQEFRQQSLPGSKQPILFVAPLISRDQNQKQQNNIDNIKRWLDIQSKNSTSVIYVSFGSWARLQPKQLVEIARALNQYSFIWSLNKNSQVYISSSLIDKERHLFIDWSPQRFILSHPSVRLFLSHGGWNSLLESMTLAKPILVWPLFGDQITNGERIEKEFQIGRCLQNTDLTKNQTIISNNEILQYLKEMFHNEPNYLSNVQQIQKTILHAKKNSSRLHIDKILKTIQTQIKDTQRNKHIEL